MLGFPQRTEIRKLLPKKAIYDKFNLNQTGQNRVDADISRLYFVNEVSPTSVGIPSGETVKMFHVIQVHLKRKDYDSKNIALLFRLIDNNMILVLTYEGQSQVAIFHGKLIRTDWLPTAELRYQIRGLDFDAVWNDLIIQIGNIRMEEGHTLDEQIAADEQRAKIQKEIERLEKLARAETQPKKKFELVQQIQALRAEGISIKG